MKKFIWSSYKKRPRLSFGKPKSKRMHEYTREEAVRLRQRVFLVIFFLILIYITYLLFYSNHFTIRNINISGQTEEISKAEIEETVRESLAKNHWLLFPGDNYFLAKLKSIQKTFNEKNILIEVLVKKKFPRSLNIEVKEKIGRLIWISNEQLFILELDGKITSQLQARELVNIGVPVVYDFSNTTFDLDEQLVNQHLVDLILEIYTTFNSYELPAIDLDYFKVDSPQANYVKMVTKQGFEIHLNYLLILEKQINKLKKSLLAGKIDLNNINYINLRIEDQVIYK